MVVIISYRHAYVVKPQHTYRYMRIYFDTWNVINKNVLNGLRYIFNKLSHGGLAKWITFIVSFIFHIY